MNRSGMSVLFLVVCVFLVAGVLPLAASPSQSVAPGAPDTAGGTTADQTAFGLDIDADSTLLSAALRTNGDADWQVVYRLVLDDDEETQAFEELQADIEDDPGPYLDPFEQRMTELAESAEQATGREMTIRNVSIETGHQPQPQADIGRVTYSFEWGGFADAENGELRAGDAVDRLFLDVDEDLTITWPAEYQLTSHQPATTVGTNRVTWSGRIEFDTGEPRVVLTTDDPDEGAEPPETTDGADDGLVSPIGAGIVGVAAVLVVVALVLLARREEDGPPHTAAEGDEHESGDGLETTADDGDSSAPPSELLSPEERVLKLVEAKGGRMKQKQVTEEFDWSGARTSQVVGTLREQGALESFRLGRENVLTLPDVDIDADSAGRSDDNADGDVGTDGDNPPA